MTTKQLKQVNQLIKSIEDLSEQNIKLQIIDSRIAIVNLNANSASDYIFHYLNFKYYQASDFKLGQKVDFIAFGNVRETEVVCLPNTFLLSNDQVEFRYIDNKQYGSDQLILTSREINQSIKRD